MRRARGREAGGGRWEAGGGGREAGEVGGRSRCKQRVGRGLDCRLGAGHGEERTRNIWLMSVTLEVSKLSVAG